MVVVQPLFFSSNSPGEVVANNTDAGMGDVFEDPEKIEKESHILEGRLPPHF